MCAMITSSMANTLFGTKSSIRSGNFLSASSLGDWGMMRSGVYTRMLRSYYDKYGVDTSNASNKTDKKDKTETNAYETDISTKLESLQGSTTNTILSDVKSAAGALDTSAKAVADLDYDKSSREDMYASVKKMADSYNAVIKSVDKSDVVSVTQSTSWMKADTKALQSELKEIGITVGADGQISVNEETFKKAELDSIKELMEGSTGYASKIAQKASGIQTLATNQMAYNSGQTFYSASGILGQ